MTLAGRSLELSLRSSVAGPLFCSDSIKWWFIVCPMVDWIFPKVVFLAVIDSEKGVVSRLFESLVVFLNYIAVRSFDK